MQTSEYLVLLLEADIKQADEYLQANFPNQKFERYSPTALSPKLNAVASDGWELVSLQPVFTGGNDDIAAMAAAGRFTHTYLCTFKRPLSP